MARAERVLEQLAGLLRERLPVRARRREDRGAAVAQDPDVELQDYFLKGASRARPAAGRSRRRASRSGGISKRSTSTTSCSASGRPAPARRISRWRRPSSYLLAKRVTRIILARPAVEAGEKLGFLPGDLQEKVNPYLRPLYDALYDMLDAERVERLLERGVIEVAPIAFMRGRTLNDAFVILDEAQNTTSEQMKMFLTRLGFGSKAVVTGDVTQIDLPPGKTSGLVEALKVVAGIEGIAIDPLRRPRRRPPRARAADRQGLRSVLAQTKSVDMSARRAARRRARPARRRDRSRAAAACRRGGLGAVAGARRAGRGARARSPSPSSATPRCGG